MSKNLGTSYDKDYKNVDGAAKRFKAMADIVDYLGAERFNKLHKELLAWTRYYNQPVPYMMLAMAGIQFYPVRAWQETLCIELGLEYTVNDDFTVTVVPKNTGKVVPLKKGHADD